MCYQEFINKMKEFQYKFLEYIDQENNIEENFDNLISFISKQQFFNNQQEVKSVLYLISKIAENHHRYPFFTDKIEQFLKYYKNYIIDNFSNIAIYEIFKANRFIIIFFIHEKILSLDDYIFNKIKKRKNFQYFLPELKSYIKENSLQETSDIQSSQSSSEFDSTQSNSEFETSQNESNESEEENNDENEKNNDESEKNNDENEEENNYENEEENNYESDENKNNDENDENNDESNESNEENNDESEKNNDESDENKNSDESDENKSDDESDVNEENEENSEKSQSNNEYDKNQSNENYSDQIDEKWIQNLPDDFNEKRNVGENDNFICQLIRKDLIEEFIIYVNKNDYSLNSTIKESIYETNFLLIRNHPTLIEYAAFFGSEQIFKYLYLNGVELTKSLLEYAIHGYSSEIIHILEENNILLEYETAIFESIKCHHNDFANYFINIFKNEKNKSQKESKHIDKNIYASSFHYQNYLFFPDEYNQNFIFYYACKYDYFIIVESFLKTRKINIKNTKDKILLL